VHLIKTSSTHVDSDGVFAPANITGPITSGAKAMDGHTADAIVHASATFVVDAAPNTTVVDAPSNGTRMSVEFSLFDSTSGAAIGPPVAGVATGMGIYTADIPVKGAKLW
jgi:hypothetical protein